MTNSVESGRNSQQDSSNRVEWKEQQNPIGRTTIQLKFDESKNRLIIATRNDAQGLEMVRVDNLEKLYEELGEFLDD